MIRVHVMAAFLVALGSQLMFAASGRGQGKADTRITLEMQNESLRKAFTRIEKLAGVRFIYRQEEVSPYTNVSVDKATRSVAASLDLLLLHTRLRYRMVNDHFIIYANPDPAPVTATGSVSSVRNGGVKGKVLDEHGQPVPGATIAITGSNAGTVSNSTGEFQLPALADGDYSLTVSSIGFEKYVRTIHIAGQDVQIEVNLKPSVNPLNEIVVVAYDNQRRASFTGSAATLKSSVIERSPRVSVQESLQGNVAGVISSNGSGQPGAVPNVRIRGVGSINAGSTPLYVVDGVPLSAVSVSSLNATDIESLTVLKDAAAASIYGSRAANGVILITTKKGVSGKTAFNATAQFGFNKVTLAADERPLNNKEMLELLREGWVNSGKPEATFVDEIKANAIDTTLNTDWFNALTRSGQYQQFDLSASGGNEKTTFYASGSYFNTRAALLGSDFKRYTGKLNVQNQATQALSFNLGLQLNYRHMNQQADEGSFGNPVRAFKRYQPWLLIYKPDGSYDLSYSNNYNPVAVVKENRNTTNDYGLLGNVGAKLKILPFLTLENTSAIDFNYRDVNIFYKSGVGTARSNGGEATYETRNILSWINTSLLRFSRDFQRHGVSAFLGYEAQKVASRGNLAGAENFLPNTSTLDNASLVTDAGSSETGNALTSVFLNTSYNYAGKYYLSASVRRDGSSRFGKESRFGNFWSVGASWNATEEPFFKAQDVFSEMRLRASYGVNGNQDIGDFASLGTYTGTDYDQKPGYYFSNYGNEFLTWEKNIPFNVGLDFGMFDNRISATVEYYTRTTSDLLLQQPISGTNGLTTLMDNIGEMRNSGIEVSLNTQNVISRTNGFTWNTSLNFSTLKNVITALNSPFVLDGYNRYVGGDFYQIYLRGFAGADPQNGESLWWVDGTKKATTNDFNKAALFDQGSALPSFFGGITNSFGYKGLTLSFHVFYNSGNVIYDNWGANSSSDGGKKFSPTDKMSRYYYNNRWRKPGDLTDAPKVMYGGTQSGSSSHNSSRFVYDGDYVRLRDVSLAYDLPRPMLRKAGIGGLRVYVRANNLATWMKDSRIGFDPEVGIDGKADQNAPIYKTILFGLDLKF